MTSLWRAGAAAVVVAGFLVGGPAQALIERFIFYPDRVLIGTPAAMGVRFEDIEFPAADGTKLHGWFVRGTRPETLLWFHGNAGNISHRIEPLRLLIENVGANVFMVDYRGYGRSAGSPSEAGVYSDARGALAYLRGRSDVAADGIVYFGQSLGSGVAIELATHDPPRGLILETPFTSVRAMASTLMPLPVGFLLPNAFDNLGRIRGLRIPKLFIHGDADEIVPYAQGRELYAAAPAPKAFATIRGAQHNDVYVVGGTRYFARLRRFLDAAGS
ncbi:alpha/beta hydrolase [Candidatus Binatia bacterium]|nr:alpha/beta hydrolase [Candidatus Binatia bacterium]